MRFSMPKPGANAISQVQSSTVIKIQPGEEEYLSSQAKLLIDAPGALMFPQRMGLHEGLRDLGVQRQWKVPDRSTDVPQLNPDPLKTHPPPVPYVQYPDWSRGVKVKGFWYSRLEPADRALERFYRWNLNLSQEPCSQTPGMEEVSRDNRDSSRSSYWYSRIVLLRCLGLVSALSFVMAASEAHHIPGNWGVTRAVAWTGVVAGVLLLDLAVFWFGLPALLWTCGMFLARQQSIYFGQSSCEVLLVECWLVCCLMCPLIPHLSPHPLPCPVPRTALFTLRWLALRAAVGAAAKVLASSASWESSPHTPVVVAWLLHTQVPWVVPELFNLIIKAVYALSTLGLATSLLGRRSVFSLSAKTLITLHLLSACLNGTYVKDLAHTVPLISYLDDSCLLEIASAFKQLFRWMPSSTRGKLESIRPPSGEDARQLEEGSRRVCGSKIWNFEGRVAAIFHGLVTVLIVILSLQSLWSFSRDSEITQFLSRQDRPPPQHQALRFLPSGVYNSLFLGNVFGLHEAQAMLQIPQEVQRARVEVVLSFSRDGRVWHELGTACSPLGVRECGPFSVLSPLTAGSHFNDRLRQDATSWVGGLEAQAVLQNPDSAIENPRSLKSFLEWMAVQPAFSLGHRVSERSLPDSSASLASNILSTASMTFDVESRNENSRQSGVGVESTSLMLNSSGTEIPTSENEGDWNRTGGALFAHNMPIDQDKLHGPTWALSPVADEECGRMMRGVESAATNLLDHPDTLLWPHPPRAMQAQVFQYRFSNFSTTWESLFSNHSVWWERVPLWGPVRCGTPPSSAVTNQPPASLAHGELELQGTVCWCSGLGLVLSILSLVNSFKSSVVGFVGVTRSSWIEETLGVLGLSGVFQGRLDHRLLPEKKSRDLALELTIASGASAFFGLVMILAECAMFSEIYNVCLMFLGLVFLAVATVVYQMKTLSFPLVCLSCAVCFIMYSTDTHRGLDSFALISANNVVRGNQY